MFCPQCGQKIPDQSKYCFACGASVGAASSFLRDASAPESISEAGPVARRASSSGYPPQVPGPSHNVPSISLEKRRRNIRLTIVAAIVIVLAGGVTYDVLAAKARAHAEAERRREADERRKEEARRRKEEQERLWNIAEQKIRAMLSYTDALIATTKGRISHRETKPTDPIWVPRFLGDVDPRPATVTVGNVRFLRSPFPSMSEVKQHLGEDCECKDWKYNGEASDEWCTWSVERPNGRKVSVTFHVYPKWDSGRDHLIQKIVIVKDKLSPTADDHADRTDYGYDEEDIQRSPSLWSASTRH